MQKIQQIDHDKLSAEEKNRSAEIKQKLEKLQLEQTNELNRYSEIDIEQEAKECDPFNVAAENGPRLYMVLGHTEDVDERNTFLEWLN